MSPSSQTAVEVPKDAVRLEPPSVLQSDVDTQSSRQGLDAPHGSPPTPPNLAQDTASVSRGMSLLGLVLPGHITRKMTENYEGMKPMDRFLVETCNMTDGMLPVGDTMDRVKSSSLGVGPGSGRD